MEIDFESTTKELKKTMWKPIETAPKNRYVLVFYPESFVYSVELGGSDYKNYEYPPTHWMELPEPPK